MFQIGNKKAEAWCYIRKHGVESAEKPCEANRKSEEQKEESHVIATYGSSKKGVHNKGP